MGTFWFDGSYYNKPLDLTYPHPFVCSRIADGSFIDPLAKTNITTARTLVGLNRMVGHCGYYVPRPYQMSTDAALRVIQTVVPAPDSFYAIMQDVEGWGGAITGDHSTYFNDVHTRIANWLGSRKRVLGYANHGDYYALWAHIASDIRVVGAGFGINPNLPRQIAWQYSNGSPQWAVPAGWPRQSAPYGAGDHNYSDLTPNQLAQALGLGVTAVDPLEEIMTWYASKADFERTLSAQARSGVWDGQSVKWWLWRLILTLSGRHSNAAFGPALLTVYKTDAAGRPTKVVDKVATAQSQLRYASLFGDVDPVNLLSTMQIDITDLRNSGLQSKTVLYRRPASGARLFRPVNDGAERTWVSEAQAASWPQGYSVLDLTDGDPFWDIPSLTVTAETHADQVEALDKAQNGATTP